MLQKLIPFRITNTRTGEVLHGAFSSSEQALKTVTSPVGFPQIDPREVFIIEQVGEPFDYPLYSEKE